MENFRKWLDNIWYHYKLPILLVGALVVIGIVLAGSFFSKPQTDLQVLYLTEHPQVYLEKNAALQETLALYAEDVNGDGEVIVTVENLYFGSEYAKTTVQNNRISFATLMMTGDCMLVVADAYGLTYASTTNFLGTLEELTPNAVCNGYGWDAAGSPFLAKESMAAWDGELYFALRGYSEDSVTDKFDEAAARYEMAKNTLSKIIGES